MNKATFLFGVLCGLIITVFGWYLLWKYADWHVAFAVFLILLSANLQRSLLAAYKKGTQL